MTTVTKTKDKHATLKRVTEKAFIDTLERSVSDSVADIVVMVGAGAAGIAGVLALNLPSPLTIWGMVVILMVDITLLFIRIARKFDTAYTTDELAERMIEMEHEITQRLNLILRDEGESTPDLERE